MFWKTLFTCSIGVAVVLGARYWHLASAAKIVSNDQVQIRRSLDEVSKVRFPGDKPLPAGPVKWPTLVHKP